MGFVGKFGFEKLNITEWLLVIIFLFAIPWMMRLIKDLFKILRFVPEKESL